MGFFGVILVLALVAATVYAFVKKPWNQKPRKRVIRPNDLTIDPQRPKHGPGSKDEDRIR